jgi:hypothetical protein
MVRLVRHRQTKGVATDMLITYHHRATSLLYRTETNVKYPDEVAR